MLRGGIDFSMLKVWAGLEARSWLQASIEDVSLLLCTLRVYCLHSFARLNDVLSTISFLQTYDIERQHTDIDMTTQSMRRMLV
jgi:hypothetical protein